MEDGHFNRIKRYLAVLARGSFVVLAIFFSTVLVGKYLIGRMPTLFRASAVIQLEPGNDADPATFDPQADLDIMRSPLVLEPVIQDLGLDRTWGARIKYKDGPLPPAEALAHLNRVLTIGLKAGTNLVQISASSEMPEEAAAIVNFVVDSYKAKRDREEIELEQSRDPAKEAIRQQITDLEQTLQSKKADLQNLREKLEAQGGGIAPGTDPQKNNDLVSYRDLSRDLSLQQSELDTLHSRLNSDTGEGSLLKSPVRIISRAQAPLYAYKPNRHLDLLLTYLVATFLSLGIASSVEVIFLLVRASERAEN